MGPVSLQPVTDPFTPADFETLSDLVLEAWNGAVDHDWSIPAGSLEWSCFTTADHMIDCVFSYALFFGSRKLDGYPNFGELHALEHATPRDLVDGLRAVTSMLWALTATAPPEARANIFGRLPDTGDANDFAARGGLEMVLHAHDVCTGLGAGFDPPRDVCRRLLDHTRAWPGNSPYESTGDPWGDLIVRSGRAWR
jgi:uncharacterized protein (TIGR03083 family)